MRSVRALLLATGLLAVFASPVGAAETSLFGNTLQITRPDGTVLRYYLNGDGTYSGVLAGQSVSGTWAETDGQLCFTQQSPTALDAQCGPLVTQSVGDTWTAARPDGSTTQLTIVAGR